MASPTLLICDFDAGVFLCERRGRTEWRFREGLPLPAALLALLCDFDEAVSQVLRSADELRSDGMLSHATDMLAEIALLREQQHDCVRRYLPMEPPRRPHAPSQSASDGTEGVVRIANDLAQQHYAVIDGFIDAPWRCLSKTSRTTGLCWLSRCTWRPCCRDSANLSWRSQRRPRASAKPCPWL